MFGYIWSSFRSLIRDFSILQGNVYHHLISYVSYILPLSFSGNIYNTYLFSQLNWMSKCPNLILHILCICHQSFLACQKLVYLRSEEHTSELQSLMRISYAVFCLKKKTRI